MVCVSIQLKLLSINSQKINTAEKQQQQKLYTVKQFQSSSGWSRNKPPNAT